MTMLELRRDDLQLFFNSLLLFLCLFCIVMDNIEFKLHSKKRLQTPLHVPLMPNASNGTKPCFYFIGNYTLCVMSQEQLILLYNKPKDANNIPIQIPHPFTALFFVYFTKIWHA
jgi:hypothetical protein